ncbi:MAG: hypothetical protein N3D74_03665 [Caldisericia bacterium]|nr:hypothetical protein [Caldisericia bacterium]
MKKIILIILCFALLFIPIFSINSQIKVYDNENIYVLCNPYGEIKNAILIDWIRVKGTGNYEVIDPYQNLSDIKKVFGEGEIEVKENSVIIKGKSEEIQDTYYRGNYNGKLPFSLTLKYYFNGKESNPEEIKGKSGNVKVVIKGESKAKLNNEIVPLLFVMTTSLDSSKIKEINLSNNTKPQILGKKYQISLMAILNPVNEVYFEFTSDKIELPELLISISPGLISFEFPDFSFLKKFLQGLDGLAKLIEFQKIYVEEIKNNLTKAGNFNFNEIEKGISELMLISQGININSNILLQISKGIDVEKLNSLKNLPQGVDLILSNMREINKNLLSLQLLIDGYIEVINKIKSINELNKNIAINIKDDLKLKLIENLEFENLLINFLLNGGNLGDGKNIISLKDLKENIKKLYDGNELIINSLENLKIALLGVNALIDSNIKIKDTLNLVINGGEVDGKSILGLNSLSNLLNSGLTKFKEGINYLGNSINNSMNELIKSLEILIKGGKIKGVDFYGLQYSSDGINNIKDGIKKVNDELEKQKESLNKQIELTKKFDNFIGKPYSSESRIQFIVKISP